MGSKLSFRIFGHLAVAAGLLAAGDDRVLFEKARALEQAGDLTGAETAYRALLKQNPGSAEALGNLGVVLARQARYDDAAEAYRRALRLRPALAPLHLNLGLAYYKAEKRGPAIEQFRLYLKKDPSNRQARQVLATALLESDSFHEAAEVFESLMPAEDFSIRLGLAAAYVRMRRNAEAQELLEQLVGRDDSPEAQVVLGQALLADNRFEDAEKALHQALRLNPQLRGVHFLLGAVKWKTQEAPAAIDEWREEVRRDPSNFEAVFALGAALAEKGDPAEARPLLEKADRMRPNYAPTLYHLGKLAWKEKRAGAQALLERSVAGDQDNRAAHYLLGQIYRARGRVAEAERETAEVRRLSEAGVREDVDILQGAWPASR